jgi:Questin oxidase-like
VWSASYASMDDALDILSAYGPDLANGLTSHGPMAAEALCAMGRSDAVLPWVERYRAGMLPRPSARERITHSAWCSALGQEPRFADWSAFFTAELQEAPWREVVQRWTARLAPGFCGSATHGVIRVGHAVRSLRASESPLRVAELADAFASWASTYQELPTARGAAAHELRPDAAIARVAVVPPERRRFTGTITSSLEALDGFPEFAPVIGLLDVSGDAPRLVDELTDVFSRVYLANAHDLLTAIVFVHGVTSVAALGNLLPYVDDATGRAALRFAWQTGCALYATFGSRPAPQQEVAAPRDDADTLVDMAIAHGDEHAIKFTEACLRHNASNPSPAYAAAARSALDLLQRA